MADRTLTAIAVGLHAVIALGIVIGCAAEVARLDAAQEMALLREPRVVGTTKLLTGKTAHQSQYPLPYLWPARSPTAGEPWTIAFSTTACTVPDEPDWPMWILASTRPPGDLLPLSLTQYGIRGGWLMIEPDLVVPVYPTAEGDEQPGPVFREPGRGRAYLRMPRAPLVAGSRMWFQLVVLTPDGFSIGPGLQVTFGS